MGVRASGTRLLVLAGALSFVIAACGATQRAGNRFNDAGTGEDVSLHPAPSDDATMPPALDSSPPPSFGQDSGGSPDVSVSACDGTSCDDASSAFCGDGMIEAGEQCDDGNSVPGDGCSGTCQIEPGYTCPTPGRPCVSTIVQICGDGKIEGSEACDDGNTIDGDGCSAACQVEPGWSCTVPGMPCTKTPMPRCGDGMVNAGEQCDDGNTISGDGCSATCQIEQGWTCPTPGTPCKKLQYCGDGVVETALGEQCDDGNAVPGDGCSGICKIEPGYACPTPGMPCVRIWICGNGHIDPGEACDDGNTVSGDGCAGDCSHVEPGYTCPNNNGSGGPCIKAPANVCGDGIVAGTEQCDDGNMISGDGCSSLCQLEPNFVCPTPGAACVSTVKCGDGKVTGNETCDDGNAVSGDGCSSTCQVEAGWQCPTPGTKCTAKLCGDGIVAGGEQCDDGNTVSGDGCSATCTLERGFACVNQGTPPKSVCHATKCGDGVKEGFEQCDDGNLIPYDGCSPTCTIEPKCNGIGGCTGACGDGLVFPGEQCDDGNTVSGDGCSATCMLEPASGYSCMNVDQAPPSTLVIPILYRDMLYHGTVTPGQGHPDFEFYTTNVVVPGLVKATLGADSEPVFASVGNPQVLHDAIDYCWWYHQTGCNGAGSTNPYDKLVYLDLGNNPTTLTLAQQGTSNVYTFSSFAFFPLDGNATVTGLGWNAGANPQYGTDCNNTSTKRNFSFTSELHYIFTYVAATAASATPSVFNFTGDDDVWAFIDNQLVVDLGGLHQMQSKSVTLNTAEATTLGLTDGGWYSIDLFQAERHTCASNYTLGLSGFVHAITQCHTVCGDGIVAGSEQCDEGAANGTGYGHCTSMCTLGPRCGDAILQSPPEQCDDGTNLVTYGGASKACGPGCKFAPYCGDGVVSNGEQCDEGALNGSGYGHCTSACKLGPRCGDGLLQSPPEQCDDGINNGSTGDKCNSNCTLKCGDGIVEAGEQCDNGTANNTGGYGKCNPNCTLGPYCGDGIKNGTEQCDDGKNDGTYGTCNPNCTLAPYCGDGILQNPPETCDLGAANSASAYGKNMCTNRCTPAPYCGDKQVDGQFGETCDDGVNSGLPGSCTPDCKAFVPLPSCGDGILQAPEQCDDGANNGTATSACDIHCRFKCGNGIKDPGEQCDNGVNDGSYGTCNSNCTLAAYCGDGIKNGPEACDNGVNNVPVSSAYGPGVCTTACTFAPYCGDGRVQSQFGEQCDGSVNCTGQCKISNPN
jgi:fibro-slime domain-containing protein